MQKIWLYGKHCCQEALKNHNRKHAKMLASKTTYEAVKKWIEQSNQSIPITLMSDEEIYNTLAPKKNGLAASPVAHQGVALLTTPVPPLSVDDYIALWMENKKNKKNIVLCLDQIHDTNNIGAIFRTAAAFGVSGVILPERNSAAITPSATKIACGGLEKVPLISAVNLSRAIQLLQKKGFWCCGLDQNADTTLASYHNAHSDIILVAGSEDVGIRPLVKKQCDYLLKIHIDQRRMESLNVSNAVSIALYQLSQTQTIS